MYCVVCLKNNARDFFCPYCLCKVNRIFHHEHQIKVTKDTMKDFDLLTMEMKYKVIEIANKRMGSILRAGFKNEFKLDSIIGELSEMVLLRHNELEIPIDNTGAGINDRRYKQYSTMKGGIL